MHNWRERFHESSVMLGQRPDNIVLSSNTCDHRWVCTGGDEKFNQGANFSKGAESASSWWWLRSPGVVWYFWVHLRSELGDGLGALRDGVLGQLSRQHKPDCCLDLSGCHCGLLGVASQRRCLVGNLLKDVIDEGVQNGHSLGANSSVWMNLRCNNIHQDHSDIFDAKNIQISNCQWYFQCRRQSSIKYVGRFKRAETTACKTLTPDVVLIQMSRHARHANMPLSLWCMTSHFLPKLPCVWQTRNLWTSRHCTIQLPRSWKPKISTAVTTQGLQGKDVRKDTDVVDHVRACTKNKDKYVKLWPVWGPCRCRFCRIPRTCSSSCRLQLSSSPPSWQRVPSLLGPWLPSHRPWEPLLSAFECLRCLNECWMLRERFWILWAFKFRDGSYAVPYEYGLYSPT